MGLTLCGVIVGLITLVRRGRRERRQDLRREFVPREQFLLLTGRVCRLEAECNLPEGPSEYKVD